jgi:hypothetical protein
MLVELTKQLLKHAGWGSNLLPGRTAWQPGENVRNVADPEASRL